MPLKPENHDNDALKILVSGTSPTRSNITDLFYLTVAISHD